MARIIACSNIKGGEGKTTLARHLALFADHHGKRTLAIDLDPQGDLTVSLRPEEGDVLYSSAQLFEKDFNVETARAGLHKATSNLDLLCSSDELDEVGDNEQRSVLVRAGRRAILDLASGYDVVIIDTPTNAPVCYETGMAAATGTLSPIQLDTYGMRGAGKFVRTSTRVRSLFNPTLKNFGFVVNRYNARSKSHRALLDDLRESGLEVLPTVLRERAAVQDALDRQMPVWSGPRGTVNREAAKEFKGMCGEVFVRAGIDVSNAVVSAA